MDGKGFFDDDETYEHVSDDELAERGITLPTDDTDGAFFERLNKMIEDVFEKED